MACDKRPLTVLEEISRLGEAGQSPDQVVQRYNEWARDAKYDKDLPEDLYTAPSLTAAAVTQHLQGRCNVRILDVGAGTGLVAIQLRKLGFTHIDALDCSEGMLDVACEKNLYERYICAFFEGRVDAIETSSYDILVCCGAMAISHIKWDVLGEMVRCVKRGGFIVIILMESTLQPVEGYKDHFEPYMKQLESEGQWVLVERTQAPGYVYKMGLKLVFKVTKTVQD